MKSRYLSQKKKYLKIKVKNLILGCGAIEARILLNNKYKKNLSFINETVGKYFLLHITQFFVE